VHGSTGLPESEVMRALLVTTCLVFCKSAAQDIMFLDASTRFG
jgi:hypothetical protein